MHDLDRFYSKTSRDSATGCLLWVPPSRSHNGYGLFKVAGRTRRATRWIFEVDHGYLPPVVMHVCDTPLCVELRHLIPGTHAENAADRAGKGRSAIGQRNGRSKLTDTQVAAMGREYRGGATYAELGRRYGVTGFGARYAIHERGCPGK